MNYTAEKYVEAEVSCSINLKVSVAWPSLHQADSGGRHLLLRRIDDPCFFLKMKSPAVVPQSLRVFFLSPLVVCFLWQYVSSHITLSDQIRFDSREKMVLWMFDSVAPSGLNPPSGVLLVVLFHFGSTYCHRSPARPHVYLMLVLFDLIFILISIMCSPEKTCGAPQDLCFSADPPPA